MSLITDDFIAGSSPVAFANSLGFTPDSWQEKVFNWNGKRLLMNCCRQSGKSTVSAILALHQAKYYEKSLILLVSPTFRQSSELFRKVTDLSDQLQVKPRLIEDNKLSFQLENRSRIVSLPGSADTIRGFSGVNLIIEDESARVSDDLYAAVRPMLAVSNGRLILLSTPFGKRGHFFDEWTNGVGWEKIKITAYECPRISPQFLVEEKRSLGRMWFESEYECRFVDSINSVFRYEDVMRALSSTAKPFYPEEYYNGNT